MTLPIPEHIPHKTEDDLQRICETHSLYHLPRTPPAKIPKSYNTVCSGVQFGSLGSQGQEQIISPLRHRHLKAVTGKIKLLVFQIQQTLPIAAQRISLARMCIKQLLPPRIEELLTNKYAFKETWLNIPEGTYTAPFAITIPHPIYYRQNRQGELEVETILSRFGKGGMKAVEETLSVNGEGARRIAKAYPKDSTISFEAFHESMERELSVLEQLKKQNVLKIAYITKRDYPEGPAYEMEPCVGDLHIYYASSWKNANPPPNYFDNCTLIAYDIAQALTQVHAAGWFHGDLKLANILLKREDGHPLVSDFGFAGRIGIDYTPRATPGYIPPELLETDLCLGDSALDMWQFGVMLYQLFFSFDPFGKAQERLPEQVTREWMECAITNIERWKSYLDGQCIQNFLHTADIIALIKGLLATNPRQRTSAAQALSRLGTILNLPKTAPPPIPTRYWQETNPHDKNSPKPHEYFIPKHHARETEKWRTKPLPPTPEVSPGSSA